MKRRKFILAASSMATGIVALPSRAAQPCPPPQISVAGGGSANTPCQLLGSNSALASLAASMSPGSWAKLTPANDQNPILGVGAHSSTMLVYCNSMPWNPVSKAIEIIGMDHGYPDLRHVRYVEATNQFVVVAESSGLGQAHGYDHNAVNPYTGDLYHRSYGGFTGTIKSRVKARNASSFTSLPNVAALEQVAIGACWWSGSFVGAGSQGCFMIFNSGNSTSSSSDGQILAYDPLAGRWFYSQEGKAPNYGSGYTYHSVMEYSAKKNVAVFGGGNVASSKLWRLDANGASVRMPDVPPGKGVGIHQGVLVDEPATGNFLLLSAGQLWELNPSGTGTWTQLTGTRVPPSGVGNPGPSSPQAVVCSSIPEYGVVAFITQPNSNGGSFFLYKHA